LANTGVVFPVDVDTTKYTIALKIYGRDALPKAVAETLNRTAEAVTKQQIKNVKRDLTVRTKFTINSMKSKRATPYQALNKATGQNVDRMFSRAGTFSRYLWTQEENFTKKGMSGPVPIPTLATRVSKNIKKTVRRKFRLSPGQSLADGNIGDNMFIGKPQGRARGIYQRGKKGVLTMLRNLEHSQVKIKGKGFHSKAVKRFGTAQFIKAQYIKVARRILKRKGIQ